MLSLDIDGGNNVFELIPYFTFKYFPKKLELQITKSNFL